MTDPPQQLGVRAASDLLAGGGEMGERMRELDWSRTPVGPIEGWPQSLKTAVRIVLHSRYPMFVWWGRELTHFYNDAYIPILGKRHPKALGRSAPEVWTDIWGTVGPQADIVLNEGRSTWNEEFLLLMERHGYTEETYFTFSYSPLPEDGGGVGGVFCACTEDTGRVLGERRLRTLRDLGERSLAEAKTVEQAFGAAAVTLAGNPHDFPFALIYLLDEDGLRARLYKAVNLDGGTPASPAAVALGNLGSEGDVWGFHRVVETNQGQLIENLEERFGRLPAGPWKDDWTKRAMVLPIARSAAQELPYGFLVAGISPRLTFSDDYRSFLELTVGQIATALSNVRAYEEERKRAEALAEIDRAKTAFFSNVSHEFRTPLTLMLGPLEDTLADPQLPASGRERLEVAHRNSLRLLKLVNTLLDFSRIESERIQAAYEPTDLCALTAELASVFRSAIERAGMRLTVDCPPFDELVYVDREMWEKIVLNLLSNAFKFTFEGEIEVSLRREGDHVELTVRDTGTGIPADELPHVFERFHRVKNARGRTFEGSGIGLALVQELVKLHGGTVHVESEIDRGTAFTVSLPLGSAHLPADRVGAARPLASTLSRSEVYVEETPQWQKEGETVSPPSARILLADDNADMREYVRRLLGQYEVVAVPDGMAALQALREQPFDLVLSDVMMPRLDGFGLLAELRSDERTKMVPVILLSARAGEEAKVEGLEAGADDYLIKPFSARELLARVDALLRLQRVRREGQAALQASEAKFSTAFDQTPLALTITSLDDGRFVEVNEGFVRLSGYTREEAIGSRPEELGVWVDPSLRDERFALLRAGKPVPNIEARFRVKSGEEMSGVIGSAIVEINGRPCVLSSVLDVTARRQAEESLRERERSLSTLISNLPGFVFRCLNDETWTMVFISEGVRDMTGYAAADFLARRVTWDSLVHPDDVERVRADAARHIEQQTPIRITYRIIAADGQVRWVWDRATPVFADTGEILVWEGFVTDITERKQAELHQELLLQIAEKIRLAEDAEILLDEMARMIGQRLELARCAFDEIDLASGVARVQSDYYGPGLEPGPREWSVNSFSTGNLEEMKAGRTIVVSDARTDERTASLYESKYRPHGYEAYVSIPLMREGRWIASLWVNKEIPYPWSPQEVGLLETAAERTWLAVERLRSEAALRASEQALKEADRRKDEFLAMLAHELRNPLAPIRNAAQVLKLLGPADAQQQWAREIIERQTQHLTRLVDDLLDVSRITRGKVKLAREPLDMAAVVHRAVEASRPLIDSRRHQLTLALPPEPVRLEGDLTRLVQIVGNLLNNAAKYTDEGGHIRLEAAREDGQAVLRVRDNGMGLPADLLPHVFDLFSQADRSLDRSQGGLGIGLTLVRRLVEMHGGEVEARSGGPGQGSEFIVRLPAESPGAVAGAGAAPGEGTRSAPGGLRVLIVEDNVDSAQMMSFMLELGGYQVRTAHDGTEALEAARAFGPHAVLCDIGLPGMNGYEVAARLREQPDFRQTPLIALTGYGEEEARRRSREAGFDHHLVKPVEPDALGALLGSLRGTPGRA